MVKAHWRTFMGVLNMSVDIVIILFILLTFYYSTVSASSRFKLSACHCSLFHSCLFSFLFLMRFDYILSNPHTLINKYTHLRICYKYFVIRGLPSCWKHSQCAENCVEYGTAVQQDDNRLHRLACHPAAVPYRLNVTCFSCSGGGASHPNQT